MDVKVIVTKLNGLRQEYHDEENYFSISLNNVLVLNKIKKLSNQLKNINYERKKILFGIYN